ncbi:putative Aldehyde dehydrogenase, dimeric NADP-preferring [Blattamonas nauphoetae]|uniref:Aldehyde dehydrogenase n=1 Tax=Blattamonas nauphoetae TaxID=2049346 RepID=A0ABQ9YKB2_9EUKA|nr:putative Aldehyde dehydrogenase, dimeric NADP-preferring [Blattamonas nauphoetae]
MTSTQDGEPPHAAEEQESHQPKISVAQPLDGTSNVSDNSPEKMTRKLLKEAAIAESSKNYSTVEKVDEDYAELRASYQSFKTLPISFRLNQLNALLRLFTEGEQDICAALYQDLHRNMPTAYMTEIGLVKAEITEAIKNLKTWMTPVGVSTPMMHIPGLTKSKIFYEPLGLALIMSPWNYPVLLAMQPLVGAIAAGCCVCVKPSTISCHVSDTLARLAAKYLDTSCYKVITGTHEISDKLLSLKWDAIFFTGSATIGKHVMRAAAEHLCPVTLELGGKSPVIIDASANLDVTARRLAMGRYMNAGQTCVAPDYVMCASSIKDKLIDKLKKCIVDFYGDDQQKSDDYARIVATRQFSRLVGLLRDEGWSTEQGAEKQLCFGGVSDEDDLYIQPTILSCSIDTDTAFLREEIFGPILPIVSFPDDQLALLAAQHINSHPKPLAMYVFSGNAQLKEYLQTHTSSGSLSFNECVLQLSIPSLPFGGVGESGMGSYHEKKTFEAFSHAKPILDKTNAFDIGARYPPYTDGKLSTIKKFL